MDRQCCGEEQSDLLGEGTILELISSGAPLANVLNRLCTVIDLQIGNVVSVILLAEDAEYDLQTIAQNAQRYGLHVYWSASIPSRGVPLGSFEIYCSISRTPNPFELRLIQRVTHLAGEAIRRHNGKEEYDRFSGDWQSAMGRSAHEEPN